MFFVWFIIFILVLHYHIKKHSKEQKKSMDDFYELERKANLTRKKSIDDLKYICPNTDSLPKIEVNTDSNKDETIVYKKQEKALRLSKYKMINLEGISNTDLKLNYGISNLDTLILYEDNLGYYTKSLLDWAEALIKIDKKEEAILVLEEGINCKTSYSKNYILLADLYYEYHYIDKLFALKNNMDISNNIYLSKAYDYINNIVSGFNKI